MTTLDRSDALIAAAGVVGASRRMRRRRRPGPGASSSRIIPGRRHVLHRGQGHAGTELRQLRASAPASRSTSIATSASKAKSAARSASRRISQFGGATSNRKTPNLLNYSGNLVVSAANRSSVVPYVTGGVGGLSLFEKASLGINDTETFFTGNVGGGVKWYAGRWGLRGDYRFIAVQSKDDAPAFFGQETRYGHRVYGGVLLERSAAEAVQHSRLMRSKTR